MPVCIIIFFIAVLVLCVGTMILLPLGLYLDDHPKAKARLKGLSGRRALKECIAKGHDMKYEKIDGARMHFRCHCCGYSDWRYTTDKENDAVATIEKAKYED